MIFIAILIWKFIIASSDPVNDEILWPETWACYQDISNPKIFFLLVLPFQTAPNYIQAEVEFEFIPIDSYIDPIVEYVTHHLILVDQACPSTVEFSDELIVFRKWKIRVIMYLGYKHSPFLDFHYEFESQYQYNLDRFIDIYGRAELIVDIGSDKPHLQYSEDLPLRTIIAALRNKRVENRYLCVFANEHKFIIKPKFEDTRDKMGHITSIAATVFQGNKMDATVVWPAYGCASTSSIIPKDLSFVVSKFVENTIIYFVPIFVDTKGGESDKNFKNRFSTKDISPIGVDDSKSLSSTSKKCYIMDLKKEIEVCKNGEKQFVYKKVTGYRLYGYKSKTEYVVDGGVRHFMHYTQGIQKCPASK